MHGNFDLSSFILGTTGATDNLFFDNLDIKREQEFNSEDYKPYEVTSSQMPVPEYSQAIYGYQNYNAGGSNVSSPASLASPILEVSPADSPVHMVPTDDYVRRGLRYALHSKRAAQSYSGFEKLHDKRRRRDDELSAEELEKRRLRRERNKEAALRCRTRRRERIEALEKETAELEEMNDDAEKEISSLRTQLEQLQQMLAEHECTQGIIDFPLNNCALKDEPDY